MATTTLKRKRSARFSPQPAFPTFNHSPAPALNSDILMTDPPFKSHPSFAHLPSPSPTPHPSPDKSSHSRTRKRFRDGRPNEQSIYATTYRKLFSASALPSSPPSLLTPHASPPTQQPRSQTSLNHFWHHLPAAPSPSDTTFPPTMQAVCKKCGSAWGVGGEDMDMDGEGADADADMEGVVEGVGCGECRRWGCGEGVSRGVVGLGDGGGEGRGRMDLGAWLRGR